MKKARPSRTGRSGAVQCCGDAPLGAHPDTCNAPATRRAVMVHVVMEDRKHFEWQVNGGDHPTPVLIGTIAFQAYCE